jgi:hypothetical protein
MGPGAGFIVGIPFVVLTLALIAILRRERIHPSPDPHSRMRLRIVRGLTIALCGFMAYLVVSIVITAVNGPPSAAM